MDRLNAKFAVVPSPREAMTEEVMSISKLLVAAVVSVLAMSNTPCSAETPLYKLSVAEFIARCQTNAEPCLIELVDIDTGYILNSKVDYCAPHYDENLHNVAPIIEWLSQHRELYSQNVMVAAKIAFKAVWPCK